jgi:hypothetical protein
MASNNQQQFILTPVGRLVAGNLYKPNTTDAEGRPLLVKNGPQTGQPRQDWFFAVAIPKGAEQHWAQTQWGGVIWQVGHAAFPQGQAQNPQFAWKIIDGDSTVVDAQGRRPCDREGYKGHWVLKWSSGFAPKIYNANGTQQIVEPDAVKPGYFVQVHGSVAGNGSMQKPGVFLNHSMVALAAYGPEIIMGPDPTAVGFGQGVQLPAGASATPPGGGFNPAVPAPGGAAALPPLPGAPAVPGAGAPPVPAVSLPAPPQAPTAVQPHPGFLQPPAMPAATPPQAGYASTPAAQSPGIPAVPPTLPASSMGSVRALTAKANGATYEQLIGAGWNDDLLRQHGMMA